MADAKEVFSIFRPLHSEAFIESPYHEWMVGQRDKVKLEAAAKVIADEQARLHRIKLDQLAEIQMLKEEAERKEQEVEIFNEKNDPQKIPTMSIDAADPKLNEAFIPDPDIHLVHMDDFKAHGSFPLFPQKTVLLKDVDLSNSLLVFLSHAWIEVPGKKLDRRIIRKVKAVEEKVDISGFYFDGVVEESSESEEEIPDRPQTPDGCSKGVTMVDTFTMNGEPGHKYTLYCEALAQLQTEFAPEMDNIYIWMDYCCVEQPDPMDKKDPDVTIGQQLNQENMNRFGLLTFDKIMTYMDCMLTCVVDEEYRHAPWQLKNSGKGLHHDYTAANWKRYLNRKWCRLEMSYCTFIPFPHEDEYQHHAVFDRKMNPLIGKGVMRAERMAGGVQYERMQARRAHLIYGTRESVLKLPPKLLPALPIEKLNGEYNPMEGLYSRAGDDAILDRLNRELWPFTRKGDAGYVGQRDNFSAVGQVGRKHGYGKMSYPNGNYYEGQWFEGSMQGKGVYHHNNGDGVEMDKYDGLMFGDLQHGESAGTYKKFDGSTYRGDWNMGLRHGIGTYTWTDGSTYRGYFEDDERHGWGDLVLASGAKFSGMWAKGKRSGKGSMKWPDGSFYEGEWWKDKRHGHGTYWTPYARGHLYVGEWKEGAKDGRGKLTLGGGEHDKDHKFHTQTEWLSGQGLEKQVLDGYFESGNFIMEADHAGEKIRLHAEASVAFEIDSDEERRLEQEAAEETEKRLQRERELAISSNKKGGERDPHILAAATEKLAAAAKRRLAIRRGEEVAPLSGSDDDVSALGMDDDPSTHTGTFSRKDSSNSLGSGKSTIPSLHLSERRPSRCTPRPYVSPYTPRPEESPAVTKVWEEIDRLEEGNLEDRTTLRELSTKYKALSELYAGEGKAANSKEALTIADEYVQIEEKVRSTMNNKNNSAGIAMSGKSDTYVRNDFEHSDSDEEELDFAAEWEAREIKSRKNSLQIPLAITPRDGLSAEIQAQWSEIDSIEDSEMSEKVDFFHLSRHYSVLSDIYTKQKLFPDALEIKKRAISIISSFIDFPRNGSDNEKKYLINLNNDLQDIRELQLRETEQQKADHSALLARREIAKILYPDHPLAEAKFSEFKDGSEGSKSGDDKVADKRRRDKNGYLVAYPHDL